MKHITILFILMSFCFACKSPQKVVSTAKQEETKEIAKDIQTSEDKYLSELTTQIIQRLTDEEIEVDIENIKYDTEQLADVNTGKYPVQEKTKVKFRKRTQSAESENTEIQKDSASTIITNDNSQEKTKTKSESKNETEKGLTIVQKASIAFGIICFVILSTWLYLKIRMK